MRNSTYRYVVQILRDYRRTDTYIKQREEELMYPYRSHDENIGGGRSGFISDTTARMAITIADDRRLSNLENNRNIVDACLNETDEVTKDLIDEMYITNNYSIVRASQEINITDRHARRLHSKFVEKVADELGLMK